MDKKRIGFMGMGIMGQAMARNILKAGYEVTVYNRNKDKCKPLADAGAKVAATPRELVQATDVTVVMVTGPEALFSLLFGADGASEALGRGKVLINMSSVSPSFSRQFQGQIESLGASFVDAPVSGSKKPAEDGALVILAGGEKNLVTELTPLFETMGKKVIYCGPSPQGSMMKMTANLLLGAMMESLCEAVNFGLKGGLDKDAILDMVQSGAMACPMFKIKEEMLKKGDYPTQFPLKHMLKDIKFVSDTAYETGAPVPVAQAILTLYRQGAAHGWGDMDFAAVMKVLEEMG